MGPPDNVEATDLLSRLESLPRPVKVVDFPRRMPNGDPIGKVALWVLKQGEITMAQTQAEKMVQRLMKEKIQRDQASRGYDDAYQNALAAEMLALACRNADNVMLPLFPRGADDVNARLTSDECTVLFEAYATWQAESGPIVGFMTTEEMDLWIARLREGGNQSQLSFLSREALTALLLYSASLQSTS